MKKTPKANQLTVLIIFIFIIGTIIAYFYLDTPSYDSLEEAIEKTSKNGEVAATYEYDTGVFVFFKNSKKKFDYYYVKDKKWYNKGSISVRGYKIEEKYKAKVYYVERNELTFIQVEKNKKEIKELKDSLDTNFEKLSTSKKKSFYFGGSYKGAPDSYTLYINGEEYLLKEYNQLFKLFQ